MTEEFDLFKAWVHSVIDRKIAEAFGQEALQETLTEYQLEEELIRIIELKEMH